MAKNEGLLELSLDPISWRSASSLLDSSGRPAAFVVQIARAPNAPPRAPASEMAASKPCAVPKC